MDDDTEVLDWSNDDDEQPPVSQSAGLGAHHSSADLDDEDAVSLGDEEEDVHLFHREEQHLNSRLPPSNGHDDIDQATKTGSMDQPFAENETYKHNFNPHQTPSKATPGSPTRLSYPENQQNSPTPRPTTRLTHALPAKPTAAVLAFIPPSSTLVEATAMARHGGRSSAKNSTPTDIDNLPAPWETRRSRDHQVYYYNPVTEVSTWTHPGSSSKEGQPASGRRRGSSSSARDKPSNIALSDTSRQPPRSSRGPSGATDTDQKDDSQGNHPTYPQAGTELSFEDRHYRPGAPDSFPSDLRRSDRGKDELEREHDRHYIAPSARRPSLSGSPRPRFERERSISPLPSGSLSQSQRTSRDSRPSRSGNGAHRSGRSSRDTTNTDGTAPATSKDRDRHPGDLSAHYYSPARDSRSRTLTSEQVNGTNSQTYPLQVPQDNREDLDNKSSTHGFSGNSAPTRLGTASGARGRRDRETDYEPQVVHKRDPSLSATSEGRERQHQHHHTHQEQNISAPRRRSHSHSSLPRSRSRRQASRSPESRAPSPRPRPSQRHTSLSSQSQANEAPDSQSQREDGKDRRRATISITTEDGDRQQQQHSAQPPTPMSASFQSQLPGTRHRDRRSRFGDNKSTSFLAMDETMVAVATANAATIAQRITASISVTSSTSVMQVDDESMVPDEFLVEASSRDERRLNVGQRWEGEKRSWKSDRGRGSERERRGERPADDHSSGPSAANAPISASDGYTDRRMAESDSHSQPPTHQTSLQAQTASLAPPTSRWKREPLPPQKERFLEASKSRLSHPPPPPLSSSNSGTAPLPRTDSLSHPPSGPREQRPAASHSYPPSGPRGSASQSAKGDDHDKEWGRSRDRGGCGPPSLVASSSYQADSDSAAMDVDKNLGQAPTPVPPTARTLHPDREALIMQTAVPTGPRRWGDREKDKDLEQDWERDRERGHERDGNVTSGSLRGRDAESSMDRSVPPATSAYDASTSGRSRDMDTSPAPTMSTSSMRFGDNASAKRALRDLPREGSNYREIDVNDRRDDPPRHSDRHPRKETSGRRQPPTHAPPPPPRMSGTNSVPIGKRSGPPDESPSLVNALPPIDHSPRRGRYRDAPPHSSRGSRSSKPVPLIDSYRPDHYDDLPARRYSRSPPPQLPRERSPHQHSDSGLTTLRPITWTRTPSPANERPERQGSFGSGSDQRTVTPPPLSREPSLASPAYNSSFTDLVLASGGGLENHPWKGKRILEFSNPRGTWSESDAVADLYETINGRSDSGLGQRTQVNIPVPPSIKKYEQMRGPPSLPNRPEQGFREAPAGNDNRGGRRRGNNRGNSSRHETNGSKQPPPLSMQDSEAATASSIQLPPAPQSASAPLPQRRDRDDRLPDHLPPRPSHLPPPPPHPLERRRGSNPSKRPQPGSLLERLSFDKSVDVLAPVPPSIGSPPQQSLRDRVQVPSKRDREEGLVDEPPRERRDFMDDDGSPGNVSKRRRRGGKLRKGRRVP